MAQCGDVSSGPFNSGDGYVIDFQYASEDQVFVYYTSNRDKVYIPQDDPTYPWTFEHATRILFTQGDPPFPIWIERITDVNPLPATFQTGNAIRAVDLNNNFQVMADAVEEAQTSVACVDDILDDVINNIQTNLQYIALPDVEALNAEAAKDPDALSGYDVLDSTGIDSLASPIVNNLPPTAGGDPGEDPVNGVYWNDGIVTRVYWDKNNQQWEFVFYFSGNADNRYQQQTIADPITPNPNDYKDGTLWFDSGDGNLYVLFNDGDSRQWVITNPLSAYGEVATTADIHWSRNAADNTVYPRNATDSITTNGGDVSLTADGNGTFTGKINTASTVDGDDGTTVTTKDYVDTALEGTLGEGFVEVAGDNMTGDLTLGTDKITLNATTGNAEFAGDVTVQNAPSPTIRIIGTGQGTALFGQGWDKSPGGNRGAVIATDNGPIVFRKGVAFDGDPGNSASGTTAMFIHQDSGNVYIGGDIDTDVTNRNIELKSDGSASFVGNVECGNVIGSSYQDGVMIDPTRPQIAVYVNNSSPVDDKIVVYNGEANKALASLRSDGSGTFAASVYSQGLKVDRSGGYAIEVKQNGTLNTYLDADGSASFAGVINALRSVMGQPYNDVVSIGGTSDATSAPASLTINGRPGSDLSQKALRVIRFPNDSNVSTEVWKIDYNGSTVFRNATLKLEPDNAANYTTTTDDEGNETQVYNGPTLDVKDRLTKTDNALKALKTAVTVANDFAALKAAITTALADL